MNKFLAVLPVVAVLAACGSTHTLQKAEEVRYEREVKSAERSVDREPKFYKAACPELADHVCVKAEASHPVKQAAKATARADAAHKLCEMIDGAVTSNSESGLSVNGDSASNSYQSATRITCSQTDMSGFKIYQDETVAIDGRFHYYMVAFYPMGKVNVIKTNKDNVTMGKRQRSDIKNMLRDVPAKAAD